MNEKRYFASETKEKPIEFNISHYVVTVFGAPTHQFEVQCAKPDDFSEFYSKLVSKEPNIQNGHVSKTENSIRLYSRPYLDSVNELLSYTPSSQEGLMPQGFQPVFASASTTSVILQNTDSLSSAANSNVNQL